MDKIKTYKVLFLIVIFIYMLGIYYLLIDYHNKIKRAYINIERKKIETNILNSKFAEIRKEQINKIYSLEMDKDDSITNFVTSNKSFIDKKYIPNELIKISGKYVYDMKGGRQVLRKDAKIAFDSLAKSFYNHFGKQLSVVSAYRSYAYQKGIKDRGCPDNLCAKAGFSEHQSGLAVDVFEATTNYSWKNNKILNSYYNWLSDNAHMYGFHNTYQKGLEIDGYEIEPWHWRFLGEELATYLKENSITIAEFYNEK